MGEGAQPAKPTKPDSTGARLYELARSSAVTQGILAVLITSFTFAAYLKTGSVDLFWSSATMLVIGYFFGRKSALN